MTGERLKGDGYYPPPPLRSSPLSQGDKEGERKGYRLRVRGYR